MADSYLDGSKFPDIIKQSLPRARSTLSDAITGWVLSGDRSQVVFWECEKGFEVPMHQHEHCEWGIVVSGWAEVTMQGKTHRYNRGDEFFIPANVAHSSIMSDAYRAIDFFPSPDWIQEEK